MFEGNLIKETEKRNTATNLAVELKRATANYKTLNSVSFKPTNTQKTKISKYEGK